MRPIGSNVAYQKLLRQEAGVRALLRTEILREFFWPIKEFVSSTQFKLTGDATALLAALSQISISTRTIDTAFTINTVNFTGTETEIELSAGTIVSTDVGAKVSRVYDISDKLLKQSLGDLSESIESSTLNLFVSSSFNCKLDNDDRYLLNSEEEQGILWTQTELLEIASLTETTISFTNCRLKTDFKGGVLTGFSGDAEGKEYPVKISGVSSVEVIGTLVTDGAEIGDLFLVSSATNLYLKVFCGIQDVNF